MHKVTSKIESDNVYTAHPDLEHIHAHIGKTVHIKGNGAMNLVNDADMSILQQNKVFQTHKANGYITIESSEMPETQSQEGSVNSGDEAQSLVGSTRQPESFTLSDDAVVSIADVVNAAFKDSGMTVEEWNEQKETVREKLIKKTVDTLDLKKE